ncbi:MAG: glycosyltransferase family 2 protein [Planctomycetota bacterium]
MPTRNRPEALSTTLEALGDLSVHAHERVGGAEVIVVDNGSDPPVELPPTLANDMPVQVVRLEHNAGAAARNTGAALARGDWLIMLDDDSCPLDVNHVWVVAEAEDDVAAIGAEIHLPQGGREDGGLPEVFVGCGAAVRREAFLDVGGFDPAFGFYAEEYDLCAKLLLAGWRVVHNLQFRVLHRKVPDGRDMNLVLRNLVRNNGWVMHRYAPRESLEMAVNRVLTRYECIAKMEGAVTGFDRGRRELEATADEQPREPMPRDVFDCFTGLNHVRENLSRWPILRAGCTAAVVEAGKHAWAVHHALSDLEVEVVGERKAQALVIGTLSLGPMLNAWERRRGGRGGGGPAVIMPWTPQGLTAAQYATVVVGQ